MGNWCARPGSNRHGLPPPSQDGASTSFATSANIVCRLVCCVSPGTQQIGGPGRTRTDGDLRRRIKNPLPWPLGAQVRDGGSGWFRTTCARVKSPLHLHSGLTLRIHLLDAAASRSGFARRAMMASLLAFARASAAWLSADRRCTPAGKFSVMVTSYAVWSSRDESNIRRSLIKRLLCH
jgi:hypothetical protein